MELTKREKEIREHISNYMAHEGCGCCADYVEQEKSEKKLAELLCVEKVGSSYQFSKYETKEKNQDNGED